MAACPAPGAAGRGGDFVPLTGNGILLDTRSGVGAPAGVRAAGSTTVFPVAGAAGVPSTGVSAVLVTVIAAGPTTAAWLVAWADGTARPSPMSMLNWSAGQTTSNAAVVPVGANGKADVYTTGATHIVIQVEGYFTTATGGIGQGGFLPVAQARLVDTRNGIGAPKATIPAYGNLTITVATGTPIPPTASAVLLNITVTNATVAGWIGANPGGTTTGNSSLNYLPGTTASSAAVKLGSGGKITVVNHGSRAIDLILDAEGYFSPQPTEGAGLRLVANRLLDTRATSTTIAAGATLDVAVGGTNGLPTRGIAGALLNLTAANGTAGGFLTAWPSGESEPATSLTAFPAAAVRSDLVSVKVGTEGKVRVRNHSGGPISLVVDLEGWFADPLPSVPPRPYSRTVALQGPPAAGAQVGALEYAYVDNIGRTLYGHQVDPSNPLTVQWSVISGNEAFSGPPALATQPDGRLRLAAQHSDTNIWSATQPAGSTAWGGWVNNGGSMASAPVVGRQTDGSLVVFAVDAAGELWALPQSGANGPFGAWRPLGGTGLADAPAVVTVQTGIQVFGLDGTGALRTATLSTAGTLSAWTDLGGSGLTGTPAVVLYPGYLQRVFVRGGDGVIVTKMQDSSGAWPSAFTPVGSLVAAGAPAALLSPTSGKTELVVRTSDGGILSTGETTQGSGAWRDWVNVLVGGDVAATDPTVLTYNRGTGLLWGFVFRDADNQSRLYTVESGTFATADTAPPAFAGKARSKPPASSVCLTQLADPRATVIHCG